MNWPAIHPAGKKIESPVGPIELTAAGTTISLSDLVVASLGFGDRLSRARQLAIESMPPGACDYRLQLDVPAT